MLFSVSTPSPLIDIDAEITEELITLLRAWTDPDGTQRLCFPDCIMVFLYGEKAFKKVKGFQKKVVLEKWPSAFYSNTLNK